MVSKCAVISSLIALWGTMLLWDVDLVVGMEYLLGLRHCGLDVASKPFVGEGDDAFTSSRGVVKGERLRGIVTSWVKKTNHIKVECRSTTTVVAYNKAHRHLPAEAAKFCVASVSTSLPEIA